MSQNTQNQKQAPTHVRRGNEQALSSTSYRLFLAQPNERERKGVLWFFVNIFALNVYGSSGLGDRPTHELRFAAMILAVVFVFDWVVWSFLFAWLFHPRAGSLQDFMNIWTVLAAVFALLPTLAIFIYERQFLTADTSSELYRVIPAVMIRLVVLVTAAIITSQPFELMVFNGPIDRRIHEESVRVKAVSEYQRLLDLQKKAQMKDQADIKSAAKGTFEFEGFELAQQALGSLIQKRDDVERDMLKHKRQWSYARRNLRYWRSRLALEIDSDKREKAKRRLSYARTWLNKTQQKYEQFKIRFEQLDKRVSESRSSVSQAKEEVRNKQEQLGKEAKIEADMQGEELSGLKKWIKKINESPPGEMIKMVLDFSTKHELKAIQKRISETEKRLSRLRAKSLETSPSKQGYRILRRKIRSEDLELKQQKLRLARLKQRTEIVYRDQPYDFFQRLRVLNDIYYGRPARWPAISKSAQKNLAGLFGLQDVSEERRLAEAKQFQLSYWIVYVIAIVIPLLILAIKLLMNRELKEYYSSYYQAAKGNPQALAFIRAQHEVPIIRRSLEATQTPVRQGSFFASYAIFSGELEALPKQVIFFYGMLLLSEWFAWSLIINALLHFGKSSILTGWTIVALILGAIFSASSFLVERIFLKRRSEISFRAFIPFALLRLGLFSFSAWVGFHCALIYGLDKPIEQRLFQEEILKRAIELRRESEIDLYYLKSRQNREHTLFLMQRSSIIPTEVLIQPSQKRLLEFRTQYKQTLQELRQAKKERRWSWRRSLNVKAKSLAAQVETHRAAIEGHKKRYDLELKRWQTLLREQEIKQVRERLTLLSKQEQSESDLKRMWTKTLGKTAPRISRYVVPLELFDPHRYGLLERFRVVEDLLTKRPPHESAVMKHMKLELNKLYFEFFTAFSPVIERRSFEQMLGLVQFFAWLIYIWSLMILWLLLVEMWRYNLSSQPSEATDAYKSTPSTDYELEESPSIVFGSVGTLRASEFPPSKG